MRKNIKSIIMKQKMLQTLQLAYTKQIYNTVYYLENTSVSSQKVKFDSFSQLFPSLAQQSC